MVGKWPAYSSLLFFPKISVKNLTSIHSAYLANPASLRFALLYFCFFFFVLMQSRPRRRMGSSWAPPLRGVINRPQRWLKEHSRTSSSVLDRRWVTYSSARLFCFFSSSWAWCHRPGQPCHPGVSWLHFYIGSAREWSGSKRGRETRFLRIIGSRARGTATASFPSFLESRVGKAYGFLSQETKRKETPLTKAPGSM